MHTDTSYSNYILQLSQGLPDAAGIDYSDFFSILIGDTTSSQSATARVSAVASASSTSDALSTTSTSSSSGTRGQSTSTNLSTNITASTTASADSTRSHTDGPTTSGPSTSTSAQNSGSGGIGTGAIAGIVIGSVIAVALVVIAVILVLRYRRAKETTSLEPDEKITHLLELQSGDRANRHELDEQASGIVARNRDVFHELPGSTKDDIHELSSST